MGENDLIVITGASRGLGAYLSEALSEKCKVIKLVRSKSEDCKHEIECDVRDFVSLKIAAKQLKLHDEPIEAFINVAGVASMNLVLTSNDIAVRRMVETNLMGTIFCSQVFAPMMVRNRSGQFINFSTIAVNLALKGEAVYAASKAGVETFSRAFAREMAPFNVRVNCISPGPIQTDLLRGLSDEQIDKVIKKQIFQKQFKKSDVLNLVELLLDQRSNSLTGQVLNIGGV